MYFNTEDTPLYISEYSLLAFGDKHLLHMLIYWDFTTLTVYQDKWKLNRINLYCMLGYIRIYSGYKSLQKNSYCAFWYFKTFTAYWDLSVLFVYNYICIKTSNVYCHLGYFRTYSVCFVLFTDVSVLYYLEFPYYVGIYYQDFLCILRFVRTYTVHWVVPRRRTWYVFYHSTRGLHWVATFGFLTTRRAWKGICMSSTKSWSLWYMNI